MSPISETYNRARNILELVDLGLVYFGTWILPNVSFATSETELDNITS